MRKKIILHVIFLAMILAPVLVSAGSWPFFKNNMVRSGSVSSSNLTPPLILKWAFRAANNATVEYSSPVVSTNHYVYISASNGIVYAFDSSETPTKGLINNVITSVINPKRVYQTEGQIYSTPAVVNTSSDTRIFVACTDGFLYCLKEGTSPDFLWKSPIGNAGFSSPVAYTTLSSYQVVACGSNDGSVHVFSVSGTPVPSVYQTNGYVIGSPAISGYNNLYFSSLDGSFNSINATNGGPLQWTKIQSPTRATQVASGNVVFVGDSGLNGYYYGGSYTGQKLYSTYGFGAGVAMSSSPVAVQGSSGTIVIVCLDNATIVALNYPIVVNWVQVFTNKG